MQAQEMRTLTDPVMHAVSRDKSRPNLGFVYLAPEDDKLLAVATDGHRLAVATSSITLGLDFPLLADPKGLASLPKSRPKGGWEEIEVSNGTPGVYALSVRDSIAQAYREHVHIDGLGELEFPNYRQILPKDRAPSGILHVPESARELLAGMSHVTGFVRVSISGNGIALEQSAEGYEAKLQLGWDGDAFETFGMNASYLLDAIQNTANANGYVAVKLQGPHSPVVFGDAFDYEVVMPTRL